MFLRHVFEDSCSELVPCRVRDGAMDCHHCKHDVVCRIEALCEEWMSEGKVSVDEGGNEKRKERNGKWENVH